MPGAAKVAEKLKSSHPGHVKIGDQARCVAEPRGRQEIGCRGVSVDRISQRSQEPAHGLAKGLVIIDD